MRLLIVAALFLISSTACASPVDIVARGQWFPVMRRPSPLDSLPKEPFHKLTDEDFKDMFGHSDIIVYATFDHLARIKYEEVDYQILALGGRENNWDLNKELSRFMKRKRKPLGLRLVEKTRYLIFPDETFSLVLPEIKDPMSSSARKLWTDAGKAYGKMWANMGPENKNHKNFIYIYAKGTPTMAFYMQGLQIRHFYWKGLEPPSYPSVETSEAKEVTYHPFG